MTSWYTADTDEALERLEGAWSDAPIENDEILSMLLDIARQQVMAFAADDDEPELQVAELLDGLGHDAATIGAVLALLSSTAPTFPTFSVGVRAEGLALVPSEVPGYLTFGAASTYPEPPARYVYAQLQQARNLWNAGRANPMGDVGTEGFSFTPRPLDKTIKTLIRPTTGAASVF